MKQIEMPKIAEIRKEEFMDPHGISACQLAHDIYVPVSTIRDILRDKRKITADTSIRLGRYFGVNEKYFIRLQSELDIRKAKAALGAAIDSIRPALSA